MINDHLWNMYFIRNVRIHHICLSGLSHLVMLWTYVFIQRLERLQIHHGAVHVQDGCQTEKEKKNPSMIDQSGLKICSNDFSGKDFKWSPCCWEKLWVPLVKCLGIGNYFLMNSNAKSNFSNNSKIRVIHTFMNS